MSNFDGFPNQRNFLWQKIINNKAGSGEIHLVNGKALTVDYNLNKSVNQFLKQNLLWDPFIKTGNMHC